MVKSVLSRKRDLSNKIDIMTVEGNGATNSILNEAGIENCDLLIAVTSLDEVNLYCCLIAKKAGAKNTIARVRNPEYAEDIHIVKDDLGLSLCINPELTAANEISRLIRYPGAIEINRFTNGGVCLLYTSYFIYCFTISKRKKS